MSTTGSQLEKLRKAVAESPESANAHYRLGTALLSRSTPEAEKELRKALELDPTHVMAWVNLGGVLLARWDFKGSVEANKSALEHDSESVQAHYNMGLGQMYLKHPVEMLDSFTKVVELDPQNAGGHYHKAVALLELNQVAEARTSLARASDLGYAPPPQFLKALERRLEKVSAIEITPKEESE